MTEDALLEGGVKLLQPASGYRVAIDPVLLAASLDPPEGATVVDLGCGVGAIALCLLFRRPDLRVVGVERDPATADLARRNAALNGIADRLRVVEGDVRHALAASPDLAADLVVTNPPYLEGASADEPTDPRRAAAHVESVGLADWIGIAGRLLKRRGRIAMVHRADRLGDVLAALSSGWGEVLIHPLWPKEGRPARRVVVTARKNVATPLALSAGTVLHEADGGFTPAVAAALAGARLEIGGSAMRRPSGKAPSGKAPSGKAPLGKATSAPT